MNDSNNTTEADERQGWYAWWSSKTGTRLAVALLVLVAATVIFGKISSLGIWEPWEANEIKATREYFQRDLGDRAAQANKADHAHKAAANATHNPPNWATPTLDGKPVAQPLLQTWLVGWSMKTPSANGHFEVGALEGSTRVPIAVAVFLLVLLTFIWIKSYFDTWPALLSAVALVTTPAIFLGAHTLSSEMLFVVLSSLSIMAFFQLTQADAPKKRWLWGALLGVALSLSFLEHRFFGLLSPLAVIVGFALTQLPFEQVDRARQNPSGVASMVDRVDIGLCVAALLGAGGVLLWGLERSKGAAGDAYFLPYVKQWIAVLVPLLVLLAGLLLARKTRASRRLLSGPGALAAAMVVVVVAVVCHAYGAANPIVRVDGHIAGKMPVFSFLLDNHLTGNSPVMHHVHFAMWVREVGFALVPWVALVPLGVGYLARAARLQDNDGEPISELMSPQLSLQRLLLVWAFVAAVVLAIASSFHHFSYPAYLPLLAGVGLMLADADFFKEARFNTVLAYAMGVVAIALTLMVGKNLHHFPDRLMEPYLAMQEDLGLPKMFSFGGLLKAIKYGWSLLLAVFFFGLVSWAGLTLRSMRQWPSRFRQWRARRKAGESAPADEADDESPLHRRAREKEAYRAEKGVLPALARLVERTSTWSALVALLGVATAGIVLFKFTPEQSAHLSDRGVFEAYTRVAKPGEKLYRYDVPVGDASVYLGDVPTISRSDAFINKFNDAERYFVVIPRKRLASINYEVRRRFHKNLPIVDASSSKLLLASNKLGDGEEQQNFIAKAIVKDPANFKSPIPEKFAENQHVVYASFDDSIELVGWKLDRIPTDGSIPTYSWGENAKMTFYFRVKKRIPGQEKIFLHIDHPGSRLHGDHEPVHGDFPTNYWLPGDIVKDEYSLHIDSYTTPGVYRVWLGFYRGDKRMHVTPKPANDGDNRMRVGKIRIKSVL